MNYRQGPGPSALEMSRGREMNERAIAQEDLGHNSRPARGSLDYELAKILDPQQTDEYWDAEFAPGEELLADFFEQNPDAGVDEARVAVDGMTAALDVLEMSNGEKIVTPRWEGQKEQPFNQDGVPIDVVPGGSSR